jgi:hypothetical protein
VSRIGSLHSSPYFLYLDISLGAQFDHCPHFVEAMTAAVDPSLAAVEAAHSIPVEMAAVERQVDTVAAPSPAVEVAAVPSLAALVVVEASSAPGLETAGSSLAVPVTAVPSLVERQLAVRQL